MSTLDDIRQAVRLELGESAPGRFSDNLLDKCIETAVKEFSIMSGCLVVLDKTITTAAGTYAYDMPAACPGPQSIIGIRYGNDYHLEATSPTALLRLGYDPDDTSETGTPEYWYPLADSATGRFKLCLFKTPNGAETLKIWYGREAASAVEVPDNYKRGVVALACELAFYVVREFGYAQAYHAKGMDVVARARAYVEQQIAAALQHRDGNNTSNLGMF